MRKLNEEMSAFFAELYEGEKKVLVFGEGNAKARIMMIGEAPGEQETLAGRPFVGKAGKNLDEFLQMSGFCRADLYITNVVKFRPTKQSAAGRTVNRTPNREEVALFTPYLLREIAEISPRVIVTLGNVPLRALLGTEAVIGEMHGKIVQADGRDVYPLYHPASMIYNRSLREVYRTDVLNLRDWVDRHA